MDRFILEINLDPRKPSGSIYMDQGFGFSQSHYFELVKIMRKRIRRQRYNASIALAYELAELVEKGTSPLKVKRTPFRVTFEVTKNVDELFNQILLFLQTKTALT